MRPPWPLRLYADCQTYRTLPAAGGILDQHDALLDLMNLCADVYYTARRLSIADRAYIGFYEWLYPDDDETKALEKLRKRRENFGKSKPSAKSKSG